VPALASIRRLPCRGKVSGFSWVTSLIFRLP
jgi:hypothetical protein